MLSWDLGPSSPILPQPSPDFLSPEFVAEFYATSPWLGWLVPLSRGGVCSTCSTHRASRHLVLQLRAPPPPPLAASNLLQPRPAPTAGLRPCLCGPRSADAERAKEGPVATGRTGPRRRQARWRRTGRRALGPNAPAVDGLVNRWVRLLPGRRRDYHLPPPPPTHSWVFQ